MVAFSQHVFTGNAENFEQRRKEITMIHDWYEENLQKYADGSWRYDTGRVWDNYSVIQSFPTTEKNPIPRGPENDTSKSFENAIQRRDRAGGLEMCICAQNKGHSAWSALCGLSDEVREKITHWYYSKENKKVIIVLHERHLMYMGPNDGGDFVGHNFDVEDGPVPSCFGVKPLSQMHKDFAEWRKLSPEERLARPPMAVHSE